MPRILRTLLFLSLVLCACSLGGLSSKDFPPTLTDDAPVDNSTAVPSTEAPTSVTEVSTLEDTSTEVSPSYPQGCGYQWAYKDMPELSSDFQESIQLLQPEAQAVAFGFGEDCIHADGSVTFIPMETDFNITLQVGDLSDDEAGEWVLKIMQVIDTIPADQIIGPRPGRVSIIFETNGQRKGAGFYIDQYHALPAGLSNAEIYRALQSQQ